MANQSSTNTPKHIVVHFYAKTGKTLDMDSYLPTGPIDKPYDLWAVWLMDAESTVRKHFQQIKCACVQKTLRLYCVKT